MWSLVQVVMEVVMEVVVEEVIEVVGEGEEAVVRGEDSRMRGTR